jgi:polyhydroxyalkanoate synthesis regulator phasin
MKKYQQLNTLVASINAVIGSQETKTAKKLFKIYEKVKTHHEDYQAKVEELRLDNASTKENDILILNEKGEYSFTKEAIKKLTEQVKELSNKEFDFTPIPVVNPQGLENFTFLEDWTTGIEFIKEIEEEL